jgi:iron complex outermembrane receptor protein/hemoglobin/transferrin/lactoferrin receptor protein
LFGERLCYVPRRVLQRQGLLLGMLCAFVSGGMVCPAQAQAQEPATPTYGARAATTREVFESAREVSTVDRGEADERAAGNVSDILETAPGLAVQRTSSGSGTPIVRGLTGYQVLLMLDDQRLNDALTRAGGSATLNLVDPESIAHVEVIRGPASVLYGSDALGGVVHVRTQRAGASHDSEGQSSATAYVRGASAERALRAQGAVQAALGPFGARVSGGRGTSGELLRGGELGTQPFTGHEDWSFASRLELVPGRNHRVGIAHQSGHLFDMPRSDVSEPDDQQSTLSLDRESVVVTYDGRVLDRALRLHAFTGMSLRREHRQRLRALRDEREREHVLGYQVGLRASGSPFHAAKVELGIESTIERIASYGHTTDEDGQLTRERGRYVNDSDYDTHALYALHVQGLTDELSLLVGGRGTLVLVRAPSDPLFEDIPELQAPLDRQFLGAVGSIGLRHDVSESFAWVTSLLGGFRAPNLEDFQAFGGGARGFTLPNPELSEERSWTLELGVELHTDRWNAQAFAFGSALSGLIVRVPTTLDGMAEIDGEPIVTRRNASTGMLVGGELAITHTWDPGPYVGASAWLTWGQTTRFDEAGRDVVEPASKIPGPTGALRAGFRRATTPYFGEAALTAQMAQSRLSEGDTMDVRLCEQGPDRCSAVPGYVDLSIRAGYRLADHLLLTLSLENVLDAAYKSYASGAYAPGRNAVVAVRGSL